MEDHHWGGQGWNSSVEPEEEEIILNISSERQINLKKVSFENCNILFRLYSHIYLTFMNLDIC
jgi:hypothetical protein